jgi:hypothetical protein
VEAEVTVAKVIEELKAVHTRHYKGDTLKGTDFEQIKQYIKKDVIKAVGMGAPRPELPPDLPEGVEEMGNLSGRAGQPTAASSGTEAADEYGGIEGVVLHANAIPQDGAAAEWTRRIDGDDPDPAIEADGRSDV